MDGKVTGLIKNGERESEVQFLFFLGFILPPLTFVSSQDFVGGGTVEQTYGVLRGNHHGPLYRAQDCREPKFRSSPLKSDRERKKRDMSVFFFFILCNDNDIIDMNNAMSATTPFPFFLSITQ